MADDRRPSDDRPSDDELFDVDPPSADERFPDEPFPEAPEDELFADRPPRPTGDEPRSGAPPRRPSAPEPRGTEGVRIIGAEEAKSAYDDRPEGGAGGAGGDDTEPADAPRPRRPQVGGQVLGEPPSRTRGTSEDRPTGSMPLPHWTEPPTGEVQAVGREEATGPHARFRDDDRDWDESDVSDLRDDADASPRSSPPMLDDDEAFERQVEERRRQVREARRAGAPPPPPSAGAGDPPAPGRPEAAPPPPARPAPPGASQGPAAPPRAAAEGAGGRAARGPRRTPDEPGPGFMGEGGLEPGMGEPPPMVPTGGSERDLPTAIITGLAIGVAALVVFNIGRGPTAWLVAIIAVLASAELYAALRVRGYRPAAPVGLAATGGLVLASYDRGFEGLTLVLGLAAVTSLVWFLIRAEDARPVVNVALTLLPIGYVGVLAAYGGLLLAFPNGVGMLLGVVIAGVAYDVIGYFVGSRMGTHRIAPTISPNKTSEGLIAGIAGAVIVSLLLVRPIHPWDAGSALWLGLVVGVAAPVGDLVESMLKRDMGIKDFGTLIPGHGGVLDRFDALLFSLPAVFYLVRVLELF